MQRDFKVIKFSNSKNSRKMIAVFFYNIPRHHGKYGTAVAVYSSREDMRNGCPPIAYFKTYKHQKTDDDRECGEDRQINDLKAKVLKNFPDVEFINRR